MIPLYGFLQGDTIGLLVLADENDTLARLAEQLQQSARVRVKRLAGCKVLFAGRELDPKLSVKTAGLEALDRFDVVAA
jgi:hypothetical protein